MSAITAAYNRRIDIEPYATPVAFPILSGETLYEGGFFIIGTDGYAKQPTSVNILTAKIVGINTGRTKTATANGVLSSTSLEMYADNDNVVVGYVCNVRVEVEGSGLTQADVGRTVYITNNNDISLSPIAGFQMGTLEKFISATKAIVVMNRFYKGDGLVIDKLTINAVASGQAFTWQNPLGADVYIKDVVVDVTTQATGAATMDVGIAATVTSSDTIFDGVDVGTAPILTNATTGNFGTNGLLVRKCATDYYITGTASADLAGLVGTVSIEYRRV